MDLSLINYVWILRNCFEAHFGTIGNLVPFEDLESHSQRWSRRVFDHSSYPTVLITSLAIPYYSHGGRNLLEVDYHLRLLGVL